MATATFKLYIFYLISYHLVAHLLFNGSQIISNGALDFAAKLVSPRNESFQASYSFRFSSPLAFITRSTLVSQGPKDADQNGLGTNKRSLSNKVDELQYVAECSNADAVCVSESWLSPQISDSAVAIPGYNLFRNDRTSAPGGGVCIYLRQTLPCTRLFQCEQPDVESLWLSLRPHSLLRSISSIILCVVYHSTANGQLENVVLSNHIRLNLDGLLIKQPNALVVIAGDFNPTSTSLKLKDLTQSNNLKQIVKFNTRDTGTLDWFLTNRPAIFQFFQLPKIARSDHVSILAELITSSTQTQVIQKVRVRDLRESAWRTLGAGSLTRTGCSCLRQNHV